MVKSINGKQSYLGTIMTLSTQQNDEIGCILRSAEGETWGKTYLTIFNHQSLSGAEAQCVTLPVVKSLSRNAHPSDVRRKTP